MKKGLADIGATIFYSPLPETVGWEKLPLAESCPGAIARSHRGRTAGPGGWARRKGPVEQA